MKKNLILTAILINYALLLFSQLPQPNFVLKDPISGNETRDYIARDFVSIIEGYSYYPEQDNHLLAKTDPLMVFPPEDGETGGPNPDDDGVVGTIPGSLGVSPSGAATYSIPIEVPSGTAGLTPIIGIVYNSYGGNGLLGMGWGISGLSAITRTGSTIYHDGYVDGIDFTENDNLSFDGQRLVSVGDNEFRTEIETFSKIEYQTNNSFVVYTKDGRIMEFGNTEDSRIETSDGANVTSWLVNRISDRKGNYIDFKYIEEKGVGRIWKISYTGNTNTGLLPYYEIIFEYQWRSDPIKSFVDGSEGRLDNLVREINIEYKSERILQYYVEYNYAGFYTHLEKITLFDKNHDDHFNPTRIEWGPNEEQFIGVQAYFHSDYKHITGDYDGDGLTDYVRIPNEIELFGENEMQLFINNGNEDFQLVDETLLPLNYFEITEPQISNYLRNAYDFNGDGLQDIVFDAVAYIEYPDAPETGYYNQLDILYSDGSSFGFTAPNNFNSISLDINKDDTVSEFAFGDFNGDAISDIFLLRGDRSWEIMHGTPNFGFSTTIGSQTIDEQLTISNVGDYNGDGKEDIMFVSEGGV